MCVLGCNARPCIKDNKCMVHLCLSCNIEPRHWSSASFSYRPQSFRTLGCCPLQSCLCNDLPPQIMVARLKGARHSSATTAVYGWKWLLGENAGSFISSITPLKNMTRKVPVVLHRLLCKDDDKAANDEEVQAKVRAGQQNWTAELHAMFLREC